MTTYRIVSSYFCAAVIVSGELVIQSAPILGWTVGRDWAWVRDYFVRKGWQVQPLPDEESHHVQWIDTEEASYELKWIGRACMRITKHVDGYEPEDVTTGELPVEVLEMIE